MLRDPEWLETDGRGGFALGTVSGIRRRRYHSLLTVASGASGERRAILKGCIVWLESASGRVTLSPHVYSPGVLSSDPSVAVASFQPAPLPRWKIRAGSVLEIEHELFLSRARGALCMRWALVAAPAGQRLCVRPLLAGGSFHHLQRYAPTAEWSMREALGGVTFQTGDAHASVLSNAGFEAAPDWYYRFFYSEEALRGYDALEDLFTPGVFSLPLEVGAELVMVVEGKAGGAPRQREREVPLLTYQQLRAREIELRGASQADSPFVVTRAGRRTIMAGYPWFEDWGRDTFIAVRGLALAQGKLTDIQEILLSWAPLVSDGLLPNRFPEGAARAEYNSVDAALWFVVVTGEFLREVGARGAALDVATQQLLRAACEEIVGSYLAGTRFGIHADLDGLLMAGFPSTQLTWMDARIDGVPVTPRAGKPVEIQCLWIAALEVVSSWRPEWRDHAQRAARQFVSRFPRSDGGLFDVIDVNREHGVTDGRIRPNQIYAVGGLPRMLLPLPLARRVVGEVERELLVVSGLRSLSPREAGYRAVYEGGPRERDSAYHQGIVWPYLMGPFVEAWIRVQENPVAAREEARRRFFTPFVQHFEEANLGYMPELTDAVPPYHPRGCMHQAWSMGERLRLDLKVLV